MPKVGLISLGCPKNLVDSEVMLGALAARGYEITPRPQEADILVVNTCSFIEPAKRESIDAILEMAEYTKTGPAKRLIVAGCLVERYRDAILRDMPEVDFVVGTNELERIVEACDIENSGRQNASAAEPYLYHEFTPRVLSTPKFSAYIKIAEGCDHPCTFCVIPQMRGRFRSRRFESLLREAENLARQGVREITLIGQDTTSYGEDLGLRNGLPTLLGALAKIPDLVWIRFLYCYPNRVTDALIETVAKTPKLVPYFDIPLQHASASVLKSMRRGSNGGVFLRRIEAIRAAMPDASLRTSLIVGYPGETEDDFKTLLEFVRAAEFDHLGVFLYSDEDSCAANGLSAKVPATVARRRRRRIMAAQREISRRKLQQMIGRTLPVLVEGPSEETELLWKGRLAGQAPGIDGQVLINDVAGDAPTPGEFRIATLTEAGDYDCVARLESEWLAPAPVVGARSAAAPPLIQIQPTPSHAVSDL